MMDKRSLRDFLKGKNIDPDHLNGSQKQQMDQAKKVFDLYKDKSEEELRREVQKLKGKKDVMDMVNSGKLDSFAQMLKPMLNEAQMRKLQNLMNEIKK